MAETEQPEKRPACDWDKDRGKVTSKPCGSEENLFKVTRRNVYGQKIEHDVCGPHLNDAIKKFNWESAEKRPAPSRTTG